MSTLSTDIHRAFNEELIDLLRRKQICTAIDFLQADPKYIEKISTLTFVEINEIKKHLVKLFSAEPINAFKYYQNMMTHSVLIPTGITKLDDLLLGGILTGTIYEICGPPASGKTTLLLAVLRNILIKTQFKVFYLDTKHGFSAKFMLDKFESRTKGLECLEKLLIVQIESKYDLISVLFDIKNKLKEMPLVKVVVINSLPVLFWSSDDTTDNNNILNHMVNVLNFIAHEYHIAVIVINLLTTWVDGDFTSSELVRDKIACGKYWQNIPNVRIVVKQKCDEIELNLLRINGFSTNKTCFLCYNVLC